MQRNLKYSIIERVEASHTALIHDHVNLYGCKIGENTKIDSFVYIEEGVKIGSGCKIRPFVFIPTGVVIGDNVFIGPNVTFTNDRYPKVSGDWKLEETVVEDDVSIGAGTVVLPGITIGKGSLVGAGSVLAKTVPPHSKVIGNRVLPL